MDGGSDGRLVGGVLRTAQGQSYGMALLQKRIKDFDKIKELADEYTGISESFAAPSRAEMGVSEFAGEWGW